jgi:hypothetical protein
MLQRADVQRQNAQVERGEFGVSFVFCFFLTVMIVGLFVQPRIIFEVSWQLTPWTNACVSFKLNKTTQITNHRNTRQFFFLS